MLVEGSFASGHDIGLKIALDLAHRLETHHQLPVELTVAGVVPTQAQAHWNSYAKVPIEWLGVVPGDKIPYYNRSAHMYFSAELNPPCPNSVIEALACGLPVVGYDTGSLQELVGSTTLAELLPTALIPGSWNPRISQRWQRPPQRCSVSRKGSVQVPAAMRSKPLISM